MHVRLTCGWALVLAACGTNAPSYFPPERPIETGDTGEASAEVVLPFRAPTDAERTRLRERKPRPEIDVPWLPESRIAISIRYEITNFADQPGVAQVFVDGANEYTEYDAAAVAAAAQMASMDDEAPFVPSLVVMPPVQVPARSQVSGVVREDDLREAAIDLDALGRWQATPPLAVLLNRSDKSRLGLEMVPKEVILPAFYKVKVTLRASQRMRLEFLVRVRDEDGQLQGDDDPPFRPNPMPYTLPAPAMMP